MSLKLYLSIDNITLAIHFISVKLIQFLCGDVYDKTRTAANVEQKVQILSLLQLYFQSMELCFAKHNFKK